MAAAAPGATVPAHFAHARSARRTLRVLALLALVLALAVTTASAYLRLGLEGRVCLEPARCGEATPLQGERTVRAVHRVAASTESVVVAALAFLAWRSRRRSPGTLFPATAALLILVLLAALGAAAGGSRLPAVTLGNLLGGFALVAALGWLHALCVPPADVADDSAARVAGRLRASRWALGLLVAQLALGAFATALHGGIDCLGGPACADAWAGSTGWQRIDPFTMRVGGDGRAIASPAATAALWLHRLLGFVAGAALCWLGRRLRSDGLRTMGAATFALACLQIGLGASSATLGLPAAIAVAHNLVAALLLLATVSARVGAGVAAKPRTSAAIPGREW